MATAIAQGQTIPEQYLAPLRESADIIDDSKALQQRLQDDGYIYLRGFFDRADSMAARRDIFARLAAVGEILEPVVNGIFSGASQRRELIDDLGAFWRSVSETWTLRRLSHGQQLHGLMGQLLDGTARVQDFIFLRPAGPGRSTHIHCDAPFFTRTTKHVATAWIALGDVPLRMGPLFIIEGSHRYQDMIDYYRGFDVVLDTSRKAARSETPLEFASERGTRLLSGDFTAGDIVIFNMFLLHGALDNVSTDNEVRLSCDVRYQLASAPLDPRYFGPDPSGTTGAGYGELVGAKAMTEDWHIR